MVNLSIIVPIYNCEKYLIKCLDSILNQTYRDFELILVDDGSTDGSKFICEEYAKNDDKIKFYSKVNEGVSIARNYGLLMSNGKYITFVDADDFLELNAYETIFKNIDETIDMIVYNYKYAKDESFSINKNFPASFEVEKNEIREVQAAILNQNFFKTTQHNVKFRGLSYPWNKIFKRKIIVDNKLEFNIKNKKAIFEDLLFVYEYLEFCDKVKVLNECLYNYRVTNESVTRKYNEEILESNNCLFNEILKLSQEHKDDNLYIQSLYGRVINNFYVALNLYFFNKNNPNTFVKNINNINKILKKGIYKEAFDNIDVKALSKNLKVVKFLVKYKLFLTLYVYCNFVNFIDNRRKK